MEDFLRLAQGNTEKNLETCGVLAGSLVRETKILREKKEEDIVLFCLGSCCTRFLILFTSCDAEKQGFPHYYAYNPKAGVNFRFSMITNFFLNLI